MDIYPAIDIKDGKCVRLTQGKFDNVKVFSEEPWVVAKKWEDMGSKFIHIVDLDGARHGSETSNKIIKKIIENINIPIQVGGGIRTIKDIEDKINLGVARVILGTVAIKKPDIVKEAVKIYGRKIAVGIDAIGGKVAVEGWEEVSRIDALQLCIDMKNIGVETIIYTDIAKDGMMVGPNFQETKEIIDATGLYIITSGGVTTLEDLKKVNEINSKGVIIGKALYENLLDLSEVINLYQN